MAFKPMAPNERASIEAQVCLKAGIELAIAEVNNGEEGVAVSLAIENATALAEALPRIKDTIIRGDGAEVAVAPSNEPVVQVDDALDAVMNQFPDTQVVPQTSSGESKYVDDEEYTLVNKIWLAEQAAKVTYASKDSMFLDNQAIRKLFAEGMRHFPDDYWATTLQGKEIPTTKTGKCGLGDFKLKKGVSVAADGTPFLGEGDGNHPLANKSGYFAGMVKNSPFTWADRPAPVDPQGWLAKVGG